MAPFLADKKEPRVAARALRLATRSTVVGEDGVFRIEVPGGPCQHGACSSGEAGQRRALRCGAVSMDLQAACELPENPIPVGIATAQFTTWVQQSSTEEVQNIPLTSCRGSQTWRQFFTTPGSLGPVLVGMLLWALGCFLYAVYSTPQIPMVSPEIFYQQVQEQIENIPVPKDSPHYSHYRRYYLQQYQQHLTQYREMEEDFKLNKGPRLNWGALLQGLGIGTWVFVAVLAFCEYRYTTVTAWMETIEEQWYAWRQRWKEDGGRGKKKTQRRNASKAKEDVSKEKELKAKEKRKDTSVKPKKHAEAEVLQDERETAEAPKEAQAKGWARWWPFEAKLVEDVLLHKEAAANLDAGANAEDRKDFLKDVSEAGKAGLEEPAVEPEPVEVGQTDPVETPEAEAETDKDTSEEEEEDGPAQASDGQQDFNTPQEQRVDADTPGSDDGSWQMVTKGRLKASLKEKPIAEAAPGGAPPPEPSPVEEAVQMPSNPETLSTQELVDFLQMSSVRRQLLRRGVPIREQLLHWFRELQEPPKTAPKAAASGPSASSSGPAERPRPKATPAPWSKLGHKVQEEKVSLRAEAPEFFPKDMDMDSMPAGTMLVPCVLPPGQDGSLAVPAGHVLLLGAMGLPEGVPLIVPTSESSWEQLNTQFDLVPPFELPFESNLPPPEDAMMAPMEDEDVIVDASNMNFMHVPAEDHVAAAIAAAAAAAEAD